MKNKIKGKGIAIQRDIKNTNGKALPKDNLRWNEGFKNILGRNKCEIRDCPINYNLILQEGWWDLNSIKDFVLVELENKTLLLVKGM